MYGRKITLHLVEGSATGIIKAKIGNWVGQVTYAPRLRLDSLASDPEIRRVGIYILAGPDSNRDPAVYIGESENVFERLKQHEADESKAFLDTVAIITSTDEALTKGHIRYLESRLIDVALSTRRAIVKNGTRPEVPPLPPADRDEMEYFLDQLQILLPVIGLTFALPAPTPSTEKVTASAQVADESPIFVISTKWQGTQSSVEARAQQINGEFVVLKGSQALDRNDSLSYKDLKEQLLRNSSLALENGIYTFVDDVPFKSPSAAAAVVRGQNTNGREYWKVANEPNKTYGTWLDERLSASE